MKSLQRIPLPAFLVALSLTLIPALSARSQEEAIPPTDTVQTQETAVDAAGAACTLLPNQAGEPDRALLGSPTSSPCLGGCSEIGFACVAQCNFDPVCVEECRIDWELCIENCPL